MRARIHTILALTIGLGVAGLVNPIAAIALDCGETVGPQQKVVLNADVGPCSAATANPALTVEGPATLDLNGHTLACDFLNPPDGIVVIGKGAKILNGTIEDCNEGMLIGGEGRHSITGVTSRGNDEDGFEVNSDSNKLTANASVANLDEGFQVNGNKNKLDQNTAADNDNDGFDVVGEQNRLSLNIAAENNDGFDVTGPGNKLSLNTSIGNAEDGFDIKSAGNSLDKNAAINNGDGEPSDEGIQIRDDGNKLKQNRTIGNSGAGLLLTADAQSNLVTRNISQANSGTDFVDENPDCDENKWVKNIFQSSEADGVANPDCIQ